MEDAVRWLQQRRRAPGLEPARPPATQAKLVRLLADLERAAAGGKPTIRLA